MDSSAISWLSEMGLDNPVFTDQFDLTDSFDDEWAAVLVGVGEQDSFDSSSPVEPPPKLPKPNNFSSFSTIQGDRSSSTPIILNFGNANSPEMNKSSSCADDETSKRVKKKSAAGRVKAPSQTYDHIIAERKRREQLSQLFVALSTIVPGLKKMDKTSVLGDAIKYLKDLQERVKILEEQATKKTMESVVLVKKSQANLEDKSPSPDEQPLPEIEARVCNSQILIRVHCENQKGLLANLIDKVEKLNLTILYTNVASFGSLALDITIITEMEKEFNLTVNEVVKRIRAALQDIL